MNEKDWYDCGARIGDLVQSAIDSNNFQQLNKMITDTINQTVDEVQRSLYRDIRKENGDDGYAFAPTHREGGNAYQDARSRAHTGDFFDAFMRRGDEDGSARSGRVKRTGRGIFSMVAGFGGAVMAGLAALASLFLGWLTGFAGFTIPAIFFAVLAAVFAIVGAKGGGYRFRLSQLERYLDIMGDRDTITLKELAAGSGKSVREVKKDLKEMISDGMFAGGAYLDDQDTTLMTSREAYRQYQETMRAYEERRAAAEKEKEAQTVYTREAAEQKKRDGAQVSEETARILEEGHDFIRHIRACNDAIPGEEMSRKLSRLEQVVTRIFDQVEKEPGSAPDLHRMMSYYLPITRKLVDAYVELGNGDIGGENIRKTRQEIEMSLDTINTAFETFLDSFYEDKAWDISSDISAMKTMMARDGLTGSGDFARTRSVAKDLESAETENEAQPAHVGVSAGGGAAAAMMEEK